MDILYDRDCKFRRIVGLNLLGYSFTSQIIDRSRLEIVDFK
jgi:hypothetical protein